MLVINLYTGGAFKDEIKSTNNCVTLSDITQPEDMIYSKKLGGVIFSSSQLSHYVTNKKTGLYILRDSGELELLYRPDNYAFLPQGLGIYEDDDESYLFVVNHHPTGDEVVRLSWFINTKEPWVDFFKLKGFKNSVDVAPYAKDKFLVTHKNQFMSDRLKSIENFFRLKSGYITHFDGDEFLKMPANVLTPHGIAVRGGKVYVSSLKGKKIKEYDLDTQYFSLTGIYALDVHPSHINWNEDKLLVTGYPSIYSYKKLYKNRPDKSSWKVFNLDLKTKESKTVISGNGEKVRAVGSALVHEGKLYGAGVFQDARIVCDL